MKYRLILLSSSLFALVLLWDVLPWLRGGEVFNWQWEFARAPWERIAVLVLALALYGAGVMWLAPRKAVWLMLWAGCWACLMPMLVIYLRYDNPLQELFFRTLSPTTTGQFLVGARIDWSNPTWHDWATAMKDFRTVSVHVALSPPALPLFYGMLDGLLAHMPSLAHLWQRPLLMSQCANQSFIALSDAERASAWFGIFMPLWASLSVVPLYAIAKRWMSPLQAHYTVGLWAIVPSMMMFAPTWNTLYPLFALVAFWALLRGFDAPFGRPASGLWFVASGFLTGLLTFANFSVVPLAALFGFYTLIASRQRAGIRPLWVGAWFAVGVALIWGGYTLFAQTSPLVLLSVAFDKHLALDRPYVPWLWMHTWEWALFVGLPLIGAWLWGLRSAKNTLAWALFATMLILVLSNTARGETARVWLFFAPFVLLAMPTLSPLTERSVLRVQFWAQAIVCVALCASWQVIVAPDIQERPSSSPPIADAVPQNARFADAFTLVGWRGERTEMGIRLTLNWRVEQDVEQSYFFSALAVAPDGSTPVNAVVWQPTDNYLTTCWRRGESLSDTIDIPLPTNAPDGAWYVSLSAFADVNNPMQTLPVTLADGTQDRQVGVGGIPQ